MIAGSKRVPDRRNSNVQWSRGGNVMGLFEEQQEVLLGWNGEREWKAAVNCLLRKVTGAVFLAFTLCEMRSPWMMGF